MDQDAPCGSIRIIPERFWNHLGRAYFVARRYAEAIEAFGRITKPDQFHHAFLAAAHAMAGEPEMASMHAKAVLSRDPDFPIEIYLSTMHYKHEADLAHHREALSRALLPPEFMQVAFYAPLKPPDHPVPSGDRQMARSLITALRMAGHGVKVVSRLRSYLPQPEGPASSRLAGEAGSEIERLAVEWRQSSPPSAWFTYHPYYKAPDLIGPVLAPRFHIPYVTAEASYSHRRNSGAWAGNQALVLAAVNLAEANFCFTGRDREGLISAAPLARFKMLPPFIDAAPYSGAAAPDHPHRLVTVAMMRSGDKFDSFRMLAAALAELADLRWTLSVIGDGAARDDVAGLFKELPAERIEWLGQVDPEAIPGLLRQGGIYVWPGYGEAYGLAYLEAQAAGLPVVAQQVAGVPEVVRNGKTGLLTAPGDTGAFAHAIRHLLTHESERRAMASAARHFVLEERSLPMASQILAAELEKLGDR